MKVNKYLSSNFMLPKKVPRLLCILGYVDVVLTLIFMKVNWSVEPWAIVLKTNYGFKVPSVLEKMSVYMLDYLLV